MYRGIVIIPKFFFRQVGAGERELFIEKTKEAGIEIVLLASNPSIEDLEECVDEISKVSKYLPSQIVLVTKLPNGGWYDFDSVMDELAQKKGIYHYQWVGTALGSLLRGLQVNFPNLFSGDDFRKIYKPPFIVEQVEEEDPLLAQHSPGSIAHEFFDVSLASVPSVSLTSTTRKKAWFFRW